MKARFVSLALVLALVGAFFVPAGSALAAPKPPKTNPLSVPVTGTVSGLTANVTQFAVQNGALQAIGTVTNAAGQVLGTFTTAVTQANGTCTILHLELGPIDLNLLGLRIQTNKIVVDITAQQGGGLLGDLLCAIANVLNNNGPVNTLATLLNRLLGLLR